MNQERINSMGRNEYPDTPRVGVGALVFHNDRVLLVERGIAPSKGLWAIPGGGLELGESLQEAAEREVLEETGLIIEAREAIYTFDFIERDDTDTIRFHYVIVDVIADYRSGDIVPGDDASDAAWLRWEDLADMPVSTNTLRLLTKLGFGA